ncbi:MAG: proline dehydrogenase [Acidobacteria bacterium]|nr:MAG: proline dehydrogenase [Acidobacteriota bacterium]PYQ82730.1 MAG: proline dehydrogenase [Acidobacteriota bacterium]PYQ84886.1 MAG: proline dehydrogenase [Acidobacteriota bacterium]PYR11964.1 MAG: proline dehydrogenase [Acidobacteriota bacterium]
MFGAASKGFFNLLARSRILNTLASRYGMRRPNSFARRFIAGETISEAIEAARRVEARGLTHTLDLLGESVTTLEQADAAARAYLKVVDAIVQSGIGRNLSLKLTQLGLDVDKASAIDNLRKILERAEPAAFFVRVDMESSHYTDVTLEVFETLWQQGHRQIGIVLQSALHRSDQDLRRINALGARVRLVKGAYNEPKSVAYQKKADVDAAYARMMRTLLTEGVYPAIATHDPKMIELTRTYANEHGVAPDRFEFQMLYGVRRDLQARLVRDGYRLRVYIPFGREWFPYFMRRLGERPANIGFVLRGILGETG